MDQLQHLQDTITTGLHARWMCKYNNKLLLVGTMFKRLTKTVQHWIAMRKYLRNNHIGLTAIPLTYSVFLS
jgi:hypothetical protein